MFELKFEDKVKVWKSLRENLESHPRPFEAVLQFTNKLPRSSSKTNAWDPKAKIEPWHLIEKDAFSEYEIAQLTAYTLQLTDRFCSSQIEIHISKETKKSKLLYLVYVDNFIDDHDYQGDSNYETNLQFTAAMVNTNGQVGVDTIIVSMLNSTTNDTGSFNYKIKVLG